MSRWLILSLMAACASAQALPPATAEEDPIRYMEEKGLFNRLDQVRHNMQDRVSDGAAVVAHRTSDLVVSAMGFLGVPYRRGGNSIETGFDCSGFVKALYEQTMGLVLPRRANEQAAAGHEVDRRDLQPGDLVFFNTMKRAFSHVGIYVGDGKFIHSPKPGAQVRVEDMGVRYWSTRYNGARRVVAQDAAVAPSPTVAPTPSSTPRAMPMPRPAAQPLIHP